ncbi:MAG TPA: Lrp/AsnC family transcriptional regulator [Burkholderiales bacterium]
MTGDVDLGLLNRWQRDFPIVTRPFERIARAEGMDEAAVIAAFRALQAGGRMTRIGALFRPNTVGASTLAAMQVPAGELERVAAQVSARAEVNHNYERGHAVNLWFVASAGDAGALETVLLGIERETGFRVLRLPLVEEYHIDLGFDLATGRDTARPARTPAAPGPVRLTAAERRLVVALADGLPFDPQPYARLGEAATLPETGVMATLRDWLERGVLRRFGAVARHRSLGFEANAMVVWDVPDALAPVAGGVLAGEPAVTLCYRRARSLPEWPYTLYCMVHGRARDTVLGQVAQLTRLAGLEAQPREILFSERCFTQRGARYAAAA